MAIMAAKPLTDEEKWQKDEWDKLILNPGNSYFYLNLVSCGTDQLVCRASRLSG
jgi:hypothetical protein